MAVAIARKSGRKDRATDKLRAVAVRRKDDYGQTNRALARHGINKGTAAGQPHLVEIALVAPLVGDLFGVCGSPLC